MQKLSGDIWEHDGYLIRLASHSDEPAYCELLAHVDPEVARLTGSQSSYDAATVSSFFRRSMQSPEHYLFLIFSPEGDLIGESVINEFDWDARSANYRISIDSAEHRGHGLGSWAIRCAQEFAFNRLGLHRLGLDVFSFNPRAQHVYQKTGFHREGVLRDAIKDGDGWADDILMSILEDEWRSNH